MSDQKLKGFIEFEKNGRRIVAVSQISGIWEENGVCNILIKGCDGLYWRYPGTYDELKAKILEAQQ